MNARSRTAARLWGWCALLSGLGVVVALAWLLVAHAAALVLVLMALGWIAVTRNGWIRRVAAVLGLAALAGGGGGDGPELRGRRATEFDLGFLGPNAATERSAQLLLVSNNRYVLDVLIGAGSRPRMDTGNLGIVAVEIQGAPALRVRLPPTAVGLSPAALQPGLSGASLRELWEIATTRG